MFFSQCIAERHSRQSLTWTQRIAAAVGIAKGIQFLHTVAGVYSNNIKITDVLLDQNLVAKISSYNLPLMAESMAKVQRFFFPPVGQSIHFIGPSVLSSSMTVITSQVSRGISSSGSKDPSDDERLVMNNFNVCSHP